MNQWVPLAVLVSGLTWSSPVRSDPGLCPYGAITTSRIDHVVEVRVRAVDGWGISTGYWARVTMGTESLSLGEALVRDLSRDGTAARELVWYVESLENRGTVVAVFCRPGSCSPPVTGGFEVE